MYTQGDQKLKTIFHLSLVVFLFLLASCGNKKKYSISLTWKDNKAVGFKIPTSQWVGESEFVRLQRADDDQNDILYNMSATRDTTWFEPPVPFTRGLKYRVLIGDDIAGEFEIPLSTSSPPVLLSIYPTADTVPENLLKIYLRFSQPMEEGHSLSHIIVLKDHDTLKGTFLDIQPELWNNDGTVLTLWLDPGRIKRDLIPNKTLGAPLNDKQTYRLIIQKNWRSKEGLTTINSSTKKFVATSRDAFSPRTENWKLKLPVSGTVDPIEIDFKEPLDFSLAMEAIEIIDSNGSFVSGNVTVLDHEKTWRFAPQINWKKGAYSIKVQSRIEDLAGNNLNRVFDRDIRDGKGEPPTQSFYELPFVIK